MISWPCLSWLCNLTYPSIDFIIPSHPIHFWCIHVNFWHLSAMIPNDKCDLVVGRKNHKQCNFSWIIAQRKGVIWLHISSAVQAPIAWSSFLFSFCYVLGSGLVAVLASSLYTHRQNVCRSRKDRYELITSVAFLYSKVNGYVDLIQGIACWICEIRGRVRRCEYVSGHYDYGTSPVASDCDFF